MKIFNWCCIIALIFMLVWLWFTIAELEQIRKEESIKKSNILFEAKEYNPEKEIWKMDLK